MVVVLDASAYLAYLLDETGAEVVERAMVDDDAVIGAVNLAEVIFRLHRRGADSNPPLPGVISVEPFTQADADLSARIVPPDRVRLLGLSLGDRACIALAQRLDAQALTCDQIWLDPRAHLPITVTQIR